MNFVVPAVGISAIIALMMSKKSKPLTDSLTAQRVDVKELILTSSINRSVKKSGGVPKSSAKTRVSNANTVMDEFRKAGIPLGVALAALVNANYESRLTAAIGDSNHSFGLFQLNVYGAGRGMTEKEMLNPHINTQTIIDDYLRNGGPVLDAHFAGASVATVSGLFGKWVERPSDSEGALIKRAKYAREMFPAIADLPSEELYE